MPVTGLSSRSSPALGHILNRQALSPSTSSSSVVVVVVVVVRTVLLVVSGKAVQVAAAAPVMSECSMPLTLALLKQ